MRKDKYKSIQEYNEFKDYMILYNMTKYYLDKPDKPIKPPKPDKPIKPPKPTVSINKVKKTITVT